MSEGRVWCTSDACLAPKFPRHAFQTSTLDRWQTCRCELQAMSGRCLDDVWKTFDVWGITGPDMHQTSRGMSGRCPITSLQRACCFNIRRCIAASAAVASSARSRLRLLYMQQAAARVPAPEEQRPSEVVEVILLSVDLCLDFRLRRGSEHHRVKSLRILARHRRNSPRRKLYFQSSQRRKQTETASLRLLRC